MRKILCALIIVLAMAPAMATIEDIEKASDNIMMALEEWQESLLNDLDKLYNELNRRKALESFAIGRAEFVRLGAIPQSMILIYIASQLTMQDFINQWEGEIRQKETATRRVIKHTYDDGNYTMFLDLGALNDCWEDLKCEIPDDIEHWYLSIVSADDSRNNRSVFFQKEGGHMQTMHAISSDLGINHDDKFHGFDDFSLIGGFSIITEQGDIIAARRDMNEFINWMKIPANQRGTLTRKFPNSTIVSNINSMVFDYSLDKKGM
jgi:hypothetical protein